MARSLTPDEALDWAFARPRTAKLGVVLPSGSPLVAPVWVGRDGDRLVFTTHTETAKAEALRHQPEVSVCFDDEEPPFAFVIVDGTVELADDLDAVRRWAAVIGGRYMGEDRADEFGARNGVPGELLVTVTPTKVRGAVAVAD